MSNEIIVSLNDLCNNCGFFDGESPVNNGFGCKHKDCGEVEFINGKGDYLEGYRDICVLIAVSMTNRNIKCNRRLAKKFLKKARSMGVNEVRTRLKKLGYNNYGKCYSFSCPIAYEVSFGDFSTYENGKHFQYIKSEGEMPQGFGDELMAITVDLAIEKGINF